MYMQHNMNLLYKYSHVDATALDGETHTEEQA